MAAWLLKGDKKYEAAEKQKWIAFEDTLDMMGRIAECLEEKGDPAGALDELDRAKTLLDVMGNEAFNGYADTVKEHISRLSEAIRK